MHPFSTKMVHWRFFSCQYQFPFPRKRFIAPNNSEVFLKADHSFQEFESHISVPIFFVFLFCFVFLNFLLFFFVFLFRFVFWFLLVFRLFVCLYFSSDEIIIILLLSCCFVAYLWKGYNRYLLAYKHSSSLISYRRLYRMRHQIQFSLPVTTNASSSTS